MVFEKRSIPCRMLLCLLACLVLFWAIVPPLNASATEVVAAAASVVGISPYAAIAGILVCLGVWFVGSGSFDELVDDIVAALPSTHFFTHNYKEMIQGLKYKDTLYVSQDLVEDVNDLLYESNALSSASPVFKVSYSLSEDYTKLSGLGFQRLYNKDGLNWHDYDFNYCYLGITDASAGTVLTIMFSDSPATVTLKNDWHRIRFSGRFALFESSPGTTTLASYSYNDDPDISAIHSKPFSSFCLADVSSISSSGAYDILVAEAAPDLDDDEEYQAWKARRLFRVIEGGDGGEDPDDDDDDEGLRVLAPYFPVPGAENAENLPSSQDQAWAGLRQEDPEDDPVTDLNQSAEVTTDPNYDPNTDSNPDTNPDPSPNPDPDSNPAPDPDPEPSPDTELSSGVLDPFNLSYLRNFFPFCIPFDLYDMLAAFVAEPEAPVFTFATGFLGNVYTVDIDLSPWNSIAKTVRAIQLCICIVGLAFATRKFIKW